jgi:hypothetical protein
VAVVAVTVYVVRCWLEPQLDGVNEWRATVYDPRNQQRRHFRDPNALSNFLCDLEPIAARDVEADAAWFRALDLNSE